jgi:hypothetical protein
MGACFTWFILLAMAVASLLGLVRWFEQTIEAVDNAWWRRLAMLVVCPPSALFYRSRVQAGRAVPVPRHQPVRGFGIAPPAPKPGADNADPLPVESLPSTDGPPPGTPAEFIGMPVMPAPKKKIRAAVDPAQLEKLRQKMRQQGMLPPE